jgi:D-alanyl-D-alanine carboxypeptidase (penicillin-binding protein 5/6)
MKGKNEMKQVLKLSLVLCLMMILAPNVSYAQDQVSARAAVAIDAASDKILYAKNPHYKQPPASTTKLVTAMVVLDHLPMDRVIKISNNAASTPTVSPRLRAGEHFTAQDLLYLTIIRSVNSAAVALAEAVAGTEDAFVELMNKKAREIGTENTRFANASGLPGGEQYITAYDLAKIMKEAIRYPEIRDALNTRARHLTSLEGRKVFVKNTNQLLWSDDALLGGKTGYTKAAQHCFVGASQRQGKTVIVALLGESVRDNLWHDTNTLLDIGYEVVLGSRDPVVFFTNIQDRPVLLASYKPNSSSQTLSKKASVSNNKGLIKKHKRVKTAKSKEMVNKKAHRANKKTLPKQALGSKDTETFYNS